MLGDEEAAVRHDDPDAVSVATNAESTDFNTALSSRHTNQCLGIMLAAVVFFGGTGGIMSLVGENVLGTWTKRWLP